MGNDSQIQGVPAGLSEEPVTSAASDVPQIQGVPAGLTAEPLQTAAAAAPAETEKPAQPQGGVSGALGEYETTSGLPPGTVGDYMGNLHQGGAYLVQHPVDSIKMLGKSMMDAQTDQAQQAIDAYKKGDYSTAVARAIYSGIPIAGPILAHSGDLIQRGEYARAAGSILAAVTPFLFHSSVGPVDDITGAQLAAAPADVRRAVTQNTGRPVPEPAPKAVAINPEVSVKATQDFKNAIPPSKSAPYTEADLDVGRKYIEPHHENVQPVRSIEDFRDATNHEIGNIEDKVHEYISVVPNDPIGTPDNPVDVLDIVRQQLADHPRGKEFVNSGLKELEGFKDLQKGGDLDIATADRIRRTLNAENKNVLSTKTNPDIAAIRESDPAFAAREVAAEALRNGIYDRLEARGIEGIRELRQDEGSLIRLRNAAENQIYKGEKTVRGTGEKGIVRNIAAKSAKTATTLAGAGTGAAVAGPAGAIVGAETGRQLGGVLEKAIAPADLSRDALIERSFQNKIATSTPQFPSVNLRAVPETPAPGQQAIPFGPSNLFDVSQTKAPAFRPGEPGTALAKIPGSTPTTHIPPSQFGVTATEGIKTPAPVATAPVRQLPAAAAETLAPAKSGEYRTAGVVRVGPDTKVAAPGESEPASIGSQEVGEKLATLQRALDDRTTPEPIKNAIRAEMKKVIKASSSVTEEPNQKIKSGFIRVRDSKGGIHDIPESAIGAATKRDPGLKVLESK